VARFVGFAPLSLTSALSGERAEQQIPPLRAARFGRDDSLLLRSQKSGAELGSLVLEACAGLGVDGEVGAEADEVRDQLEIAADEAELAAKLLPWVGHGAGYPLPPPVREAGVEAMANHEDMGCSDHQICLSKGVIAKFVQPLDLVLAVRGTGRTGTRAGGAIRRVCSVVAHEEIAGDRTGSVL
jgi:hypothetical protein